MSVPTEVTVEVDAVFVSRAVGGRRKEQVQTILVGGYGNPVVSNGEAVRD